MGARSSVTWSGPFPPIGPHVAQPQGASCPPLPIPPADGCGFGLPDGRRRRALAALIYGLVPANAATAGPITGIGGKCVDVASAGTANGTAVQIYTCNGTSAQQWTLSGSTWSIPVRAGVWTWRPRPPPTVPRSRFTTAIRPPPRSGRSATVNWSTRAPASAWTRPARVRPTAPGCRSGRAAAAATSSGACPAAGRRRHRPPRRPPAVGVTYTAAQVLAGVQQNMTAAKQVNTKPHINTMTRAMNVNVYQVATGRLRLQLQPGRRRRRQRPRSRSRPPGRDDVPGQQRRAAGRAPRAVLRAGRRLLGQHSPRARTSSTRNTASRAGSSR